MIREVDQTGSVKSRQLGQFSFGANTPVNQTVEVAGPDNRPLVEFASVYFKHTQDPRQTVADNTVPYFGASINDQSLTPGANPIIGKTRFQDWLKTH